MFNETKVLMELKNLLGKEFTIPELCESYGYNTREFAEYFFELDKENIRIMEEKNIKIMDF